MLIVVNRGVRETEGNSLVLQGFERPFLRQFLVVSHLLFAVGLISLVLAEGQMFYVAVGLVACLLSAWGTWAGREVLLPVRGSTLLAGLVALWAVIDIFFISRSVLFGFFHALVFLQAVKILQRKMSADYRLLYLITFVQLVLAAAVTVSVLFAVVFPAYLIAATWAVRLLHLRLELERAEETWPGVRTVSHGGLPRSRASFVGSTAAATCVFGVGLAIFLALPRISLGLMSLQSPLAVVLSGFSKDVTLGDLGRILLSSQVVMRVELPEPLRQLGNEMLWRGVVLDQYTGRGWRVSDPVVSFVCRSADGLFHLPHVHDVPEEVLLRQDVVVEGMRWPVLFAAFQPARFDGNFRWIRINANGSLSGVRSHRGGLRYTVWSVMPDGAPSPTARPRPLNAAAQARYLQLPPLSPRVHELARDIVQGAVDSSRAANEIAKYLRTRYAYTLGARPGSALDPVEDFLFRRRAGHCEYFASAMAVMLRAVGIPSRVVNGFRGAEWNSFGNYYVVRGRNAHAWVEAFLPGQGWVMFDPTPPSRSPVLGSPGFLASVSQFADTFRWRWHRYVIDFDASSQRFLARWLVRHVSRGRSCVSSWGGWLGAIWDGRAGLGVLGLWFAIGALCTTLILFVLRRRAWATPCSGRDGARARVDFYAVLLKLLARWGYVREVWRTPRELARWVVAREGDEARAVEEVTETYYHVRYGGRRLAAEERHAVDEFLRDLEGLKGGETGRPKGRTGVPVS